MQTISESKLLEALQWRYATKVFDPKRKIPSDTWHALKNALILSASSFGLQPYRFLIIEDPKIRAELVPHAWNQQQVVDASHFVVLAARTGITESEINRFLDRVVEVRGGSPQALAGYRQMMTGSLLSPEWAPRIPAWAAHQAYIALGSLLTTAALLGVDACPMEGFVPAEFDRILNLKKQGYTASVCCALGYRDPSDKYATLRKVRMPETELVKSI